MQALYHEILELSNNARNEILNGDYQIAKATCKYILYILEKNNESKYSSIFNDAIEHIKNGDFEHAKDSLMDFNRFAY